jgi:D-alanine-D-alanine ligase
MTATRKRLKAARKLRVLVLMHPDLIPPADVTIKGEELEAVPWKTEYDILRTLRDLGHESMTLGIRDELNPIRNAISDFKPHIVFNLLEGFADIAQFDQNVVAYLELLKIPYTGCNSRGLFLGRDKAVAKKLLSYHRIPVPAFAIFAKGRPVRRPRRLTFPLFVKSLTEDASIGISQASVVDSDARLEERVRFIHEKVGTHALVEHYIEGRELYVGVLGNEQLKVLPTWELLFKNMPEDDHHIATERLKWSKAYQKKHGIDSGEARDLPNGSAERIPLICKRVYKTLMLSGCARVDLRLTDQGQVYVIEANPNPQLSSDEDFAQSARKAGLEYPALIQRIINLGLRWETTRLA